MQTDQQRLAEIEARAKKATPGPWDTKPHYCGCVDNQGEPVDGFDVEGPDYVGDHECQAFRKHDADFVGASREDVPYLLGVVRALAAENEELRRAPSKVWCVSVRFYDHDGDPSLYATEAIANAHADQLKDRLDKVREPYKNVMVYEQDVECSPPAAGEGAG